MRRIHQLFIKADQEPIRRATIESGRKALCWYPSAGIDLRHIKMLEEEGLNNPVVSPPLIYIHTDVWLPRKQGGLSKPGMRIVKVTEIHPKRVTREFSRDVCYGNADKNTGRVFLMEVEIDTVYRGRLIRIPVPILYFIAENLSFLVHVFLRYQIRLDTLIHIRDGGASLGGSKIPMNFIYQTAPVLKLKRVVSDASPEVKTFNTRTDFDVLMNAFMHQYDRHLLHVFHEQLREIPLRDIRSAWEGRLIDRARMPPKELRSHDVSYYDWRPKKNTKS